MENEILSVKKHMEFVKKEVSLFRHPVLTLHAFAVEMRVVLARFLQYCRHHIALVVLVASILSGIFFGRGISGPHQRVLRFVVVSRICN